MSLSPGARLGPYEIVAPLGVGGMGEVYQAKDPRIEREVAIKVLPAEFGADPERLRRFAQEARATGALNHPNVLAVFDVGEHEGEPYLVTELLEGETLRVRLATGTLPVRKAVDIGTQIARGLAAAHEKGIVHRDLKPENVFLTKDGHVKILDFGLAKVDGPMVAESGKTLTTPPEGATGPGVVLGTVGYMSPELVRGKPVDHRTDLFSLGAVLYEMLTGRRAFQGNSAVETMYAIIVSEPAEIADSSLAISPTLERIVRRCLEKTPEQRFQSARDLAFALGSLSNVSSTASGAQAGVPRGAIFARRNLGAGALALAAILLALVFTVLHVRSDRQREAEAGRVMRFQVVPPTGERLSFANSVGPGLRVFAISPDGARLAYVASKGVSSVLRVRSLDSAESAEIPGTEGAWHPFFSPDGKWIAFAAGPKLKKVAVSGGTPVTLCDAPSLRGGVWGEDGWIYFVPNQYVPISRIPAAGGTPQSVTRIRTSEGEQQHRWPELLPGDRTLVYVVGSGGEWDDATIVAERLDTGERKVLVKGGTFPRYLPTGHLVYARAGALYALAFDARSLAVEGSPVEVARSVFVDSSGFAQMDISRSGMLVTAPLDSTSGNSMLSWVDRAGRSEPLNVSHQAYFSLALSPDGVRVALTINNSIAVLDLDHLRLRKLTLPARAENPAWSGDGRRLYFGLEKGQNYQIYSKGADDSGTEQITFASNTSENPIQISTDDTRLLTGRIAPDGQGELLLREVDRGAPNREPKVLFKSLYFDQLAAFSPDARWVAYQSEESGRPEVYVRPASGEDRKWQVSAEGGGYPIWSPDGKEIFFLCGMKFMAAPVEAKGEEVRIGAPRVLFENHEIFFFDVARDGKRFLVAENPDPAASPHLDVVVNWFSEVKRKTAEAKTP